MAALLYSARMRVLASMLIAFTLTACASLAPAPPRFRILQINDVYKIEGLENGRSGGMARIRTLREQLQSDGTAVFVLHGGDALFPSVMSKYLNGEAMIDVMNMLDGREGFDPALIAGFGNHEFDAKDADVLLRRLRESEFQWLATNTLQCDPSCDSRFTGVPETIVRDVDGIRVGFMGLLYHPFRRDYVQTTDVIEAARAASENLRRDGADVIIAITHQDMAADAEMARVVPEIDLVVGGHDHLFMQERVGDTWITKADADAKSVIVYDVTLGRDGIRTVPLRVVLDTTVAKDSAVDERVQQWLQKLSATLGGNETLGTTENLLEGVEPAVRGRETALGNLLADAARAQMGTEVALINGGSIRINDNIPPGPITRYDMEGIFYYANRLVAFRLNGAQLLDMLRNSVSRADAGDGRFLQVSGLRFRYHRAGNGFTVDPQDVQVGGRPLDLDATYSVATSDYQYLHGEEDEYTLFGSEATRPAKINVDREADFRQTVEKYIRERGTIDTDVEGRIVRESNL